MAQEARQSSRRAAGRRPLAWILAISAILGVAWTPARAGAQGRDEPRRATEDQSGSAVVATVGDRAITLADVDREWGARDPASRAQARQQLYDARQQVLDAIVGDYLIELEARARKISVSELLEAELPKRMTPVTDEDIARVYRELGTRAEGATIEQLTPPIRQFLEQQRPIRARQLFVEELKRGSTPVRMSLAPPRLEVTTAETDPSWGPRGAPVVIVEFSDFQCPFCQRAGPVIQKVRAVFGDRVRLVFKDFPLPSHPNAFQAAEAAQCAHDQGKFWEYHDVLFANQEALGRDDLKRHAVDIGLDPATFSVCFDEGRTRHLVQADIDESQRYGVSSTPTFFINGRLVNGAQPFEVLDRIIREELASVSR